MTTTLSPNEQALRGLASRTLTARTDERLCTTVVDIITARVGRLETADRIPVLCTALGVPRNDWKLFSRWADEVQTYLDPLYAYIDVMVADRCRSLRGDLLSDLIVAEADGDELTADELGMLVVALLTARL